MIELKVYLKSASLILATHLSVSRNFKLIFLGSFDERGRLKVDETLNTIKDLFHSAPEWSCLRYVPRGGDISVRPHALSLSNPASQRGKECWTAPFFLYNYVKDVETISPFFAY